MVCLSIALLHRYRPAITRDLITRWRLIEQLNNNINRPLTLVCTWLEGLAAGHHLLARSIPALPVVSANDTALTEASALSQLPFQMKIPLPAIVARSLATTRGYTMAYRLTMVWRGIYTITLDS